MQLVPDLTFLNEISDGDKAFIDDVLQTFLEEMPKDMAQMETGVQTTDIILIGKMAHKTKSTLQTLGLYDLKELAFKIEQTAKSEPSNSEVIVWANDFIKHINLVYPNIHKML